MELDFTRLFDDEATPAPKRTETPPDATAEPTPYPIPLEHNNAVQRTLDPLESDSRINAALKVLERDKFNREAAEGIMLQLELDISRKKDPTTLLLYAAEALDRLSGKGDGYIRRIENALEKNGYTH